MKVIGRAVAREVGQYPVNAAGSCDLIEPGREFDVYEVHGVPGWAEEVVADAPKAPAKKAAKGAPPTVDEIA